MDCKGERKKIHRRKGKSHISTSFAVNKLNIKGDMVQKRMLAGIFEAPGKIKIDRVGFREPADHEVLVRLEGCGICGSNIPLWEGRPWFTYPLDPGAPGHEGWGRVESVGDAVVGIKGGDRVVLLSHHAFAQYDTANEESCVKLPDELDNVMFPGEPVGCAMNVFERSDIHKGHTVVVVGAGFLGCLLISLAVKAGASVTALSRRLFPLQIASSYGAATVQIKDKDETVTRVKKIVGENGCDRVIEAAGFQNSLDIAGDLTKTGGKLIIAGYHQDGLRTINMQMWNWKGIDVINAHERETSRYMRGIRAAVKAVVNKEIDISSLITHTFRMEQLSEAFATMLKRPEGFLKSVVTI